MNFEYKHLLPEEFSLNSRVWIYQSSRLFSLHEAFEIEDALKNFTEEWLSHGDAVKAYANLFFGQFIVLMADETRTAVSGCSTDNSVRFIKGLGERFKADLFNRTNLAFIIKDKIQVLPINQLSYALQNNFITPDTPFFDNSIQTKENFEKAWIIPVKSSWLAKRLAIPTSA